MMRAVSAGLFFAISGVCWGCSNEAPAPAPPPPPSASAPLDELAPEELAEGPATAFGLPLPAKLKVQRIAQFEVRAQGQVPFERVANYVRHRVDAASILTGPAKTLFEDVKVKRPRGTPPPLVPEEGPNPEGDMILRVEVSSSGTQTTIVCERVFRPRVKEGLTQEQRWERMGLTKDGKPADPNKFE